MHTNRDDIWDIAKKMTNSIESTPYLLFKSTHILHTTACLHNYIIKEDYHIDNTEDDNIVE